MNRKFERRTVTKKEQATDKPRAHDPYHHIRRDIWHGCERFLLRRRAEHVAPRDERL